MKEPTSIKRNFITAHPYKQMLVAALTTKFGSVLEEDKIKTTKI